MGPKKGPTRRQMLAAAGAVTLSGCNRVAAPPKRAGEARVTVAKCAAYGRDVYDVVMRLFQEHRLNVRGKRVVLKPNLVEFEPGSSINTHPMVVHAAFEAMRALGAAEVRIAEGPGHRRNTFDLADAAGYFHTIRGFEDSFTDLNLDDVVRVPIAKPVSKLKEVYLPQTIVGADLVVSIPKMKTHHWVGATLGMKNFFGIVPGAVYGWPKNVLHWAGINECIADLHNLVPHSFTLVDGIVGMEGNGPIQGTPKAAGVLVAGADMPAVDATCCRIMKINPERVDYLQFAGMPAKVVQLGESVESVATAFAMLPQFDYLRVNQG